MGALYRNRSGRYNFNVYRLSIQFKAIDIMHYFTVPTLVKSKSCKPPNLIILKTYCYINAL